MFLENVFKNNEELIDIAVKLHVKGEILPNTYVIDLDAVESNSKLIKEKSDSLGLEVFAMTKQIGRNEEVCKSIVAGGIDNFVVVDYEEAITLIDNGFKIGNVGHIVQMPRKVIPKILKSNPKYITVYSYENAKEISESAENIDIKKPFEILLKLVDKNSAYRGQEGGIRKEEIIETYRKIKKLKNIKVVGITAFPCFLYNKEDGKIEETKNMEIIKIGKEILEKEGADIKVVNTPSSNMYSTLEYIKKIGGTQIEPGHALTGTTPMHKEGNEVEKPAIVYVSEISHFSNEKEAHFYGGGLYQRGNIEKALVGSSVEQLKENKVIASVDTNNIDYYGKIKNFKNIKVGDTVIMSFRAQIFTARSTVVTVSGISSNKPKVTGVFTAQGIKIK